MQQARQAAHDGQPQSQALPGRRRGWRAGAAGELGENGFLQLGGDPHAGVPDLDQYAAAPSAGRQQHASLGRVRQGIGEQVVEDAAQQGRIGVQGQEVGATDSRKPRARASDSKSRRMSSNS